MCKNKKNSPLSIAIILLTAILAFQSCNQAKVESNAPVSSDSIVTIIGERKFSVPDTKGVFIFSGLVKDEFGADITSGTITVYNNTNKKLGQTSITKGKFSFPDSLNTDVDAPLTVVVKSIGKRDVAEIILKEMPVNKYVANYTLRKLSLGALNNRLAFKCIDVNNNAPLPNLIVTYISGIDGQEYSSITDSKGMAFIATNDNPTDHRYKIKISSATQDSIYNFDFSMFYLANWTDVNVLVRLK